MKSLSARIREALIRIWSMRLDRWRRFRVYLFIMTALIAVQLVSIVAVLGERVRDTETGFRFPLPAQAAAIAQMVEQTAPKDLPMLLDAVNSPDLRVAVLSPDRAEARQAEDATRSAKLEWLVESYASALAPLEAAVYLRTAPGETLPGSDRIAERFGFLLSDKPLRLDITLPSRKLLRIETRGDLTRRVLGWPVGLLVGVLGLILGLVALRTIWSELRPLRELAERVDRFARAARPQLMREKGPPEIQSVIRAFNRMQTRLSELLASRSVMLGALGHDLRTYLTRLRLRAELVEHEDQRDRTIRDLDAMDKVIAASTMLSRLETAPIAAHETGLAPIFETLADARPELRVAKEARRSDAVVWGDRDAIHLAVENLIANAERYGEGSEIEVALEIEDDPLGAHDPLAHIFVLDRGPGIEEAQAGKLFDPFTRGDAARNLDAPGSGLGLAIVAAVARAHRGQARLKNREGGGLEARLTLPVAF